MLYEVITFIFLGVFFSIADHLVDVVFGQTCAVLNGD